MIEIYDHDGIVNLIFETLSRSGDNKIHPITRSVNRHTRNKSLHTKRHLYCQFCDQVPRTIPIKKQRDNYRCY